MTCSKSVRSGAWMENSGDSEFWKNQMRIAEMQVDYGEPLPEMDDRFLSVWAAHYASIVSLIQPQAPLLEIGSGYGILASGLGKITGASLFSTEHPSRSYFFRPAYREFLKRYKTLLIGNDLNDGLPFKSDLFEQVYFCDVIEHLPTAGVGKVLDEIHRVLRPEGVLVVSTPNLNRLSNLFRFLRGFSMNPPLETGLYGRTFGHIREFAPKELTRILADYGFAVIGRRYGLNPYFTSEAFGSHQAFSPGSARIINRLTAIGFRIFPGMGDQMFLTAVRKACLSSGCKNGC